MSAPEKIAALRRLLAASAGPAPDAGRVRPTGLSGIDDATGGLPLGAVTEIVCAAPSCGGHLLLGRLLAVTRARRERIALIDAGDCFDPESFPADLLAHLVWVRCPGPLTRALQAADLLARDANLTLAVIDLRLASAVELRRTPGPLWYRLQRAVESADLALVIETPFAVVPCARVRLEFTVSHDETALGRARSELAARLSPVLQRHRLRAVG
ncbi:MAG: hypothetical protein ACKOE8_14920 [Opitutaceae bacterium]